jgi:hypothetical protein
MHIKHINPSSGTKNNKNVGKMSGFTTLSSRIL